MGIQQENSFQTILALPTKNLVENRRYRRIAISKPAEILINSIDIHDGQLINISPAGAAVQCQADVSIGDIATIYAYDIDILPGRIVRLLPDGFALSLILSKSRRQKLMAKLFAQINTEYAQSITDRRATPRHLNTPKRTLCRLADGTSLYVTILDMSVNGACVITNRKPAVGSTVRLEKRDGIIIRHTLKGFAISFNLPRFKAFPVQVATG